MCSKNCLYPNILSSLACIMKGLMGLRAEGLGRNLKPHEYVNRAYRSISRTKCLLLTTVSSIHGHSFMSMTKCYVNIKPNFKVKPAYQSSLHIFNNKWETTHVCHSKNINNFKTYV